MPAAGAVVVEVGVPPAVVADAVPAPVAVPVPVVGVDPLGLVVGGVPVAAAPEASAGGVADVPLLVLPAAFVVLDAGCALPEVAGEVVPAPTPVVCAPERLGPAVKAKPKPIS